MYTTPTTAIVAVGTVTPVAGVLVGSAGTDTAVNAAPVAGPGLAEVAGATATNQTEVLEVLGVRMTRGDNPLVDTMAGIADGTLPFTGVNVLFLILSAITVVLLGLTMVRIGRNLTTAKA